MGAVLKRRTRPLMAGARRDGECEVETHLGYNRENAVQRESYCKQNWPSFTSAASNCCSPPHTNLSEGDDMTTSKQQDTTMQRDYPPAILEDGGRVNGSSLRCFRGAFERAGGQRAEQSG